MAQDIVFCPEHSAHKRAIDHHDERLDAHSKQLDDQRDTMYALSLNLTKLTDLETLNTQRIDQTNERIDIASRRLDAQDERLDELEQQPAQGVLRVRDAALNAVGGAIGAGAILAVLIALGLNTN